MSLQQLQARSAAQADPSFSGSVPGIPDSAFVYPAPDDNDDSLPLPDHFPEPYTDPDPPAADRTASRSSVTLETGQTLVYCSTERVVNKPVDAKSAGDVHNGVDGLQDEAKEGVRRITDKYAAPGSLLRNASVSGAWAGYDPGVVSPKDTLPSAPTPSITLPSPSSPSPSAGTYNPLTVMMNGGHSGGAESSSRSSSSAASPTQSSALPTPTVAVVAAKQYGSGGGVLQHDKLTPLSVPAFSDASSDLSDASPSPVLRTDSVHCGTSSASMVGAGRYQSISGVSITSLGDGVTEQDVQQVEMFYKSHRSDVIVCHSLANLYIGSATATTTTTTTTMPGAVPNSSTTSDSWEFVTTGIPLLVLDTGDHHRPRQLSIVVAEKGTGFVLWKDVVSHLTRYACPHANFHTLRLSADHNKLAGLSFDDSQAASEFAASVLQLTSDPDDDLLMLSKNNKKKSKKQKKQESKNKPKYKPPKKTDISQPCCFQHITKLERPQMGGLVPLPPNTFPPAPGGSVSSMSDVFHERLSLSMSRARSRSSELSEASTAPSDH